MLDSTQDLSLVFPGIACSVRESTPSLKRLLYKGGSGIGKKRAEQAIREGDLGEIRIERIELVRSIHAFIERKLACGGSPVTARNQIDDTAAFFAWADQEDEPLTVAEIHATYVKWAEYLFHRVKVVKNLGERTAYTSALRLGQVIDSVLERQKPILQLTRFTRPSHRKPTQGIEAEKQNLHTTFAFGRLLQDICDGLPLSAIWAFRIEIPLQGGGVVVPWAGGSLPSNNKKFADWEVRNAEERKRLYESGRSLDHRGRKAVVNMRILAELLMFIGQTGMNLAQAHTLKLRHFNYSGDIDGYKVRDYKHRRGGEVLFEVFNEYRSHFERYLEWRRTLFKESEELFPVIREGSHKSRPPLFDLIIGACKQAGIKWTPPSALRGTRVNWLLRRSGDPDLTSEMVQHHKQTLLGVYERPSLQRTTGEVARFWLGNDPALASATPSRSVAPGQCDGKPAVFPGKPKKAPLPDCIRPSGCLWCEHHRDIDSFDYVWSLACFRYLKVLEMSKHVFPLSTESRLHPAQHAIDKLTEKLAWFKSSNSTRRNWVEEALARIEEGNYHSEWARLIYDTEGTSQ